jgi:hypothetical protein
MLVRSDMQRKISKGRQKGKEYSDRREKEVRERQDYSEE